MYKNLHTFDECTTMRIAAIDIIDEFIRRKMWNCAEGSGARATRDYIDIIGGFVGQMM